MFPEKSQLVDFRLVAASRKTVNSHNPFAGVPRLETSIFHLRLYKTLDFVWGCGGGEEGRVGGGGGQEGQWLSFDGMDEFQPPSQKKKGIQDKEEERLTGSSEMCTISKMSHWNSWGAIR